MFPLTVLEKTGRGELAAYDIYSRLLKDRIIFLGEEITEDVAACIVAQFLHLGSKKEDIHFYIMSPGGSISAGLAIYDTMQFVDCTVSTYCIGEASSMAAILLAAGSSGRRFALPTSRIMIHQPWSFVGAVDAKDLEISSREMARVKKTVYERLSHHTGRSIKQIEKDCDRDCYMTPMDAKRYGIIDSVIEKSRDR